MLETYCLLTFVYAFLAALLIFYGTVLFPRNQDNAFYILLVWACSYMASFLLIIFFLPQFTITTSIGQLVDKTTLNETLADFRLAKLQKLRNDTGFEQPMALEEQTQMNNSPATDAFVDGLHSRFQREIDEKRTYRRNIGNRVSFRSNPDERAPSLFSIDKSPNASFRVANLPKTPASLFFSREQQS